MPTLILTPRYTADAQALWRAAGELGWDVERLTSWSVPEELCSVTNPVLYLEGLMAPLLAEQFGQRLLEPPEDWLPKLPEEYRRRNIYRTTLGEARSLRQARFVKPPNDKSFPARVYTGEELPLDFEDDISVLVSDVVEWEVEFRCFILNRHLQTFSVYLREGVLQTPFDFPHTPEEESALVEFTSRILGDERVPLPRATVVDVGVIRSIGWAVVEQNAAWGSGIYGCDAKRVLQVLRFASEPV